MLIFAPVLFYASAMQAALLFEAAKSEGRIGNVHIELDAENAGWLWRAPGMPALSAISNDLRLSISLQTVGKRFSETRELVEFLIKEDWQAYETIEQSIIPDDAVTIFHAIGVAPYYLPNLTVIDLFGLTDAVVARNPVTHPNQERQMAHDREPPPGYLEERGVNITLRPLANTLEAALTNEMQSASYAIQVGPNQWMPFESPDQHWVLQRFGLEVGLLPNRENAIDRAATLGDQPPAIDSKYAVYHIDESIIYVKENCAYADLTDTFLLHIIPSDPTVLPAEQQQWGFDNHDFQIRNHATYDAGACVASIPLPSYPIAAIKTGQYNADGVRLWEGEIRLETQ